MKRQISCVLATMALLGCVDNNSNTLKEAERLEQLKQEATELAQQLETEKDPIKVVEAYITYFGDGSNYEYLLGEQKFYDHEVARGWHSSNEKTNMITQALALPGTRYDCMGNEQSDECILYRRSQKPSKVAYFDYKRFLGNNTRIKDDVAFLKLVRAYGDMEQCDKQQDVTTDEKNSCKERHEKYIRLSVKQKVRCKNLIEFEYNKQLRERAEGYRFEVYAWHYSHTKAMNDMSKVMRSFADEYMCDITGWDKELLEQIYN